MADDILNINGKLIRLKDNGDGTWSWATALTGSSLQNSVKVNTGARPWTRAYNTADMPITVPANSVAAISVALPFKAVDLKEVIASVRTPDASHSWKLYVSVSPIYSGGIVNEIATIMLIDKTAGDTRGHTVTPVAVAVFKGGDPDAATLALGLQNLDTDSAHSYHMGVAVR